MSVRKMIMVTMLGASPMLMMAPPAISGDKIDIQTPGASVNINEGNKLLKAGDTKVKIKPGERADCLRIKAGNTQVKKGKIKHDECKS